MRKSLLVGGILIVAAVAAVVVSDLFDLKLEPTIPLGLTVGAVVALVPDGTPGLRLGGFVAGIAAAWIGYLVRAGFLPDSVAGRAVSVVLVLAVCTTVAAVSAGRAPLWSGLLGAAAMAGAYEYSYTAAPPEVTTTSLSAVTALLMTSAIGFLAAAVLAASGRAPRVPRLRASESEPVLLDDMMESAR